MSTALHLCSPEDVGPLSTLMQRHAAEHALPQTPEDRAAALRPLLEGHPYGMVYLLGPKKAPVGYVIVTLTWSLEHGGLIAEIAEMHIREAVRGRGISSEVLIALGKTLGTSGIRALCLPILATETEAPGKYRQAGFTEDISHRRLLRRL